MEKRYLLNENVLFYRGSILDGIIDIERKMDDYLSSYFCSTLIKKNQLNELLFFTERISLDVKRQIFIKIIPLDKPEFLKENSRFLKKFEGLVPHRNIMAHLELFEIEELDDEKLKQCLVFKKYKDGKITPKVYDEKSLNQIKNDIVYVHSRFLDLLQEVPALV